MQRYLITAALLLTMLASLGKPVWAKSAGVRVDAAQKQPSSGAEDGKNPQQRGTIENPLVVDTTGHHQTDLERKEAEDHATKAKEDEEHHQSVDRWTLIFAGLTALGTLGLVGVGFGGVRAAISTLEAIKDQVIEMRSTGIQTEALIKENIAQSASLERSVAETARFASAMEGVSKSLEITAMASQQAAAASQQSIANLRQQMRAWLTVLIGGGIAQNREHNIRFDARPNILNTGLTPARNVRTRSKSAILTAPLPAGFDCPIEDGDDEGGNFIGAHQTAQTIAVVDGYVPDEQVDEIKNGKGPAAMYVWGIITYDDVFGDSHTTKFCQRLTWLPDGAVYGYYVPGRNDAD